MNSEATSHRWTGEVQPWTTPTVYLEGIVMALTLSMCLNPLETGHTR